MGLLSPRVGRLLGGITAGTSFKKESKGDVSAQMSLYVSTSFLGSDGSMSVISSNDPDFRVCWISFNELIDIQLEAEDRAWATRWTSVAALRSQVKEEDVILQSLMREEWGGSVRSYRCLLLFSIVDGGGAGGVATIDLHPVRFNSLEKFELNLDVKRTFSRMFSLALGGISMIKKS